MLFPSLGIDNAFGFGFQCSVQPLAAEAVGLTGLEDALQGAEDMILKMINSVEITYHMFQMIIVSKFCGISCVR